MKIPVVSFHLYVTMHCLFESVCVCVAHSFLFVVCAFFLFYLFASISFFNFFSYFSFCFFIIKVIKFELESSVTIAQLVSTRMSNARVPRSNLSGSKFFCEFLNC